MNAGFRYGLFLGLLLTAAMLLAPRPAGEVAVFTLCSAQLLAGGVILWRRTRLKYATGALLSGAAGIALLAYLASTRADLLHLPPGWAAALVVLLLAGPVLFAAEARANPDKWQAWRDYMARKSLLDILRARHIPHLR